MSSAQVASKLASGEATGAAAVSPRSQSTLLRPPTADVVVTLDGEGALLAPASDVSSSRFRRSTRPRFLASSPRQPASGSRADVGPGGTGSRSRSPADSPGIAQHARDGRRLRARAPASSAARSAPTGGQPSHARPCCSQPRSPGRVIPLRGLDRRRRGLSPLPDRAAMAGARSARGGLGGPGLRASGLRRHPASPGRTTSSSGSSAAASPAACSAHHRGSPRAGGGDLWARGRRTHGADAGQA